MSSHSRAVNKYADKSYDRIRILTPKGEKKRWAVEARNRGFDNVSQFVRWAVEDKIGKPQSDSQSDCIEMPNDLE